jgi:hypothetical protein
MAPVGDLGKCRKLVLLCTVRPKVTHALCLKGMFEDVSYFCIIFVENDVISVRIITKQTFSTTSIVFLPTVCA